MNDDGYSLSRADLTNTIIGLTKQNQDLQDKLRAAREMPPDKTSRYKLLCKQAGKQGDTIFKLRGIVAELQELISKEDRGIYRRIKDRYLELWDEFNKVNGQLKQARDTIKALRDENSRLAHKVDEQLQAQS